MRAFLLALGLSALPLWGTDPAVPSVHGAGATFPYPLYARWSHDYEALTGIAFNYQSIGSGGGILQVQNHTTDFGATDAPLTEAQLDKAGLDQFPMVIGGVVPVVNLPALGKTPLKLTGPVLADIFLGRVTRWNDPSIAALNPGLRLPATEIGVVTRADGSGTTWLFTHYLSLVSGEWSQRVGAGTSVHWPLGIAGKGNEGVAGFLRQVEGSIGFLELAYARPPLLAVVLKNRGGEFVPAGRNSFAAAARGADWTASAAMAPSLLDRPDPAAWPITGASYILVPRKIDDPAKARALVDFFTWCLGDGRKTAEATDYAPLDADLAAGVKASWVRWAGKGETAPGGGHP